MSKELIEAPQAVLQLVLDEAILPHLVDIEKELSAPLRLAVTQGVQPGQVVQHLATPDPPEGREAVTGDLQVSFRKNYGGDRFLFRAEAIFPKELSPDTGFSGFNVPGAVAIVEDGYRLEATTWTVQYNVWQFRRWL